jgi:DNA processing protein
MDTNYIATLLATPKISRKTVYFLLNSFSYKVDSLDDLRNLLIEGKVKNSRIHIPEIEELKLAYEKTLKNIEMCERQHINIIDINNSNFPEKLKKIPNPPVILYYKGNIESIKDNMGIAVIGTRNPTKHGEIVSNRLGYILGKKDIVVISGLAIGCDSAAHRGCLESNGRTVAVLAHGLDRVYPSSNKKLAEEILANNGCLISEYAVGTTPLSYNFVDRDRIQSGLSEAVIVVETDEAGGTMQTVKFSEEQKKNVGCYLHDSKYLNNPQTRGNQLLINQGKAIPIKNETDLQAFILKIHSNEDISIYGEEKHKNFDKTEQITFF